MKNLQTSKSNLANLAETEYGNVRAIVSINAFDVARTIKRLKDLGYSVQEPKEQKLMNSRFAVCVNIRGERVATVAAIIMIDSWKNSLINCGNDTRLFFALAARKSTPDFGQWMITKDGDLFFYEAECNWDFRIPRVSEIVRHFKELQKKDYDQLTGKDTDAIKSCTCQQCGKCFIREQSEQYVVIRDDLWARITDGQTGLFLCADCIEKRLGYKIGIEDLKRLPDGRLPEANVLYAYAHGLLVEKD